MKLTSDRKFHARALARSRGVHPADFLTSWGSAQAEVAGSNNEVGYKNEELDKLAIEIDKTFDKAKRIPLVQKLARILAEDLPWGWTYERPFFPVAYWNKYSFPGKGYFKYSDWQTAFHYWWLDKDKVAKLKKAMKANQPVS